MRYPHIAARVFDTPLLIAPKKLDAILSFLGPRMGFEVAPRSRMALDEDGDWVAPALYETTGGGIAIINVFGTLIQRGDLMTEMSGLTSYEALGAAFDEAMADPMIGAIVFNIDSPGGECAGCFDFAERIYEARDQGKALVAVVNEMACSAAYLIASATDRIVTTRTGYSGSIGVVSTHIDVSGANEQAGVVVTHIYAGDHKIDGTPYAPLSEGAEASINADIQRLYGLFTETVARNRQVDVTAVIATQAEIYAGQDAIDIGLADEIGTLRTALNYRMVLSLPSGTEPGTRGKPAQQEAPMTGTHNAAGAGSVAIHKASTPKVDGIVATDAQIAAYRTEAKAEGHSEGLIAGRTAERERMAAILDSEEAKGRDALARHFAFESDMSADLARSALAKSPKAEAPKAEPPKPGNRFDEAMKAAGNPQVGLEAGEAQDDGLAFAESYLTAKRQKRSA